MGRVLFSALALILALSAHVSAQTTNGTLGGTVADATGALIPGVTITATNAGTGIANMGLTNESGAYQFGSLQPGTYQATAELHGFQTQAVNNFTLRVSQQASVHF